MLFFGVSLFQWFRCNLFYSHSLISKTAQAHAFYFKNYFYFAADSGIESSESDDEFQICDICSGEEVNIFLDVFILHLHVY